MNKAILKQYKILFYKRLDGEKIIDVKNQVGAYLFIWRTTDMIDDFLIDVNLCLDGQISSVEDTDYSDGLLNLFGTLTADSIIIKDRDGHVFATIPLLDFKELLLAWKEFLG